MKTIGIVGGGPAGLMAAESAAMLGARVALYDAMPSLGRKFLVAGKSGLNITNNTPFPDFLEHYSGTHLPSEQWAQILNQFDNSDLRSWVQGLGLDTFAASSGKVFPGPDRLGMKAAPLLRRWIQRLRSLGVSIHPRHRWTGVQPDLTLSFSTPKGEVSCNHDAIILALGGASWPRTGSDGAWTHMLEKAGITITPLEAANCGWEAAWPDELIDEAAGLPIKNLMVAAESPPNTTPTQQGYRGELVLTHYGLEGGPIYRLGPALRQHPRPALVIDFKPDSSIEQLTTRMGKVKRNFVREAKRRWKLDPASCALLKHLPDRGPWQSVEQLAREVKHCHIPLLRPRPIEEAISSAGGISWQALDQQLMLTKLPGVFVAGEMIDWEAPTGGYLLQACFATGRYAAKSAHHYLSQS
ncbi:TIGR03862 family flavoprotein [Verrucomicrobiaceae bacterium N1E253]|uniref:TIGR03862 family flavoprotein n=1 Tax=Oceaniferula marina TaxID=2748318 RepID=A0A851GIH1_9BACT|nr:TIGR03862 family flavoprotein [Oceaniferula marina]NWK56989.1 TIGR03862 family flavoprotein [Oceaniferula marina]